MFELITALALMSFEPTATTDNPDDQSPNAAETILISEHANLIKNLSLNLELIDERETTYIFSSTAPFLVERPTLKGNHFKVSLHPTSDIDTVRRRVKTSDGAPYVGDVQRLPSFEYLQQGVWLNRKYQSWLRYQMAMSRLNYFYYEPKLQKAKKVEEVFEKALMARRDYCYIWVKRIALKELKDDLLTEEAYYTGWFPSPIPLEDLEYVK